MKDISSLMEKLDGVFFKKCPTCGWSQKQGHECMIMFQALMKIETAITPHLMAMGNNFMPETIDINVEARKANEVVKEIIREWHEKENKL